MYVSDKLKYYVSGKSMKANDFSVSCPLWDLEELLFYPIKVSLGDSGLRSSLNPDWKILFFVETLEKPPPESDTHNKVLSGMQQSL